VRAHECGRILGFVWVDFDRRQLVRVVRSVNELAPVDKLNRAVAIVIHLYTLAHEFRQSHVHIPGLDHAPVDVHDHTLVVKRAHVSDLVRLVARAAHCDHQLYPAQWFPSPLNRWCVRQACIPHACAYSYRATGALTLTYKVP
jgi:hypothetical protein